MRVAAANDWQTYRTRFLIRAKQLTEPLFFVDALGREHRGQKGDYLVESSDGMRRIAPREIFEDVYVAMGPAERSECSLTARSSANPTTLLTTLTGQHSRHEWGLRLR